MNEFLLSDEYGNYVAYFEILKTIFNFYNALPIVTSKGITTIKQNNDEIDKFIEEINNLRYWNDYIMFKGKKYGVPPILKNIHRENDCFGNIEFCSYDAINLYIYICSGCGKHLNRYIDKIYEKILKNTSSYIFSKYVFC